MSFLFNHRFVFVKPPEGDRPMRREPEETERQISQPIEAPEIYNKNPEVRTKLADENAKEATKIPEGESSFKESLQKAFLKNIRENPEKLKDIKNESKFFEEILKKKKYENFHSPGIKFEDLETEKYNDTFLLNAIFFGSLGGIYKSNTFLNSLDDFKNSIISFQDNNLIIELKKHNRTLKIPKQPGEIKKALEETISFINDLLASKEKSDPREIQSPSGILHDKFLKYHDQEFNKDGKTPEKVTEVIKNDRKKLSESDISTIRTNPRLLIPRPEKEPDKEPALEQALNLKKETARRIRAYTKSVDGEWFTLDYQSLDNLRMGSDKSGLSHELHVGLGDILVDTDIQNVLVLRSDGSQVLAHRGVVKKGKHAGRVGFLDEKNNYVATFTNDKFRIIDKIESNLNDAASLASYTKKSHYEDQVRIGYQQSFEYQQQAQKYYDSGINSNASGTVVELNENGSVVDQMKGSFEYMLTNGKIRTTNLTERQRASARIIEEVFRKQFAEKRPDVPKKALNAIIAAAIINAFHESSLYPSADGKKSAVGVTKLGEDSVGLFALYIKGRGAGMTDEERQDPYKNTERMLESYVFSHGRMGGDRLIAEAIRGTSVADLAAIFCKDGERPAKAEQRMQERAFTANHMFPTKLIESPETKNHVALNYKNRDDQINHTDLASNQKTWLLGSSTVNGMHSNDETGICAIVGINPANFYRDLTEEIWPRIKNLKLPEKITLVGMGINGLTSSQDEQKAEASAERNIQDYLRTARFWEEKGVKVEITTLPPYQVKLAAVKAFNKKLREDYPKYCNDTAKLVTTPDGNDWLPGMIGSGGYHLSSKARQLVQNEIQKDNAA